MNVSTLVTTIRDDFAPDYSDIKILSLVNRAVQEMFRNDCAQAIWYNHSDIQHPYPYLNISDGVLSYNVTSDNLLDNTGSAISLSIKDQSGNDIDVDCRRVKNVLVFHSHNISYNPAFYEPLYSSNTDSLYYFRGLHHHLKAYKVLCQLTDRFGNQPANIQFINQPHVGTKYYVEFYYAAPEITSVNSLCVIDLDVWSEAIIDGVRGYLEAQRNGNTNLQDKFRTYWIQKFINSMNIHSADLHPHRMPTRRFG